MQLLEYAATDIFIQMVPYIRKCSIIRKVFKSIFMYIPGLFLRTVTYTLSLVQLCSSLRSLKAMKMSTLTSLDRSSTRTTPGMSSLKIVRTMNRAFVRTEAICGLSRIMTVLNYCAAWH